MLTDSGPRTEGGVPAGRTVRALRDETEWVETLVDGWNALAGADAERILTAARRARPAGDPPPVFGDGHAAERMVGALERST